MTKYIDYGGYDITVRDKDNGTYELSAMVESMGEEYREHMLADTLDDNVLDKFVRQIERSK